MSTSAQVALAKAAAYDPAEILAAVRACLDHLGGIRAWVKPGQRVLLKPNLLGGFPVERAVTTHPAVIRAVALLVREAGGEPWIGDSPGIGALDKVASRCGLEPVLAETGARLVDFSEAAEYPVPGHRVAPQLTLTRVLREVDVIISLPKLKTHGHLVMTGALKNQYGLIPGSLKSQWHFRLRQPEWMAALILDIDRVARPALAIMDAVVAMEGAGPSAGQPRQVGALLAGACLVAVDVVACRMIGLQPPQVPVLAAATSQHYGTTDPRKIEVVGDDWRSLCVPDFAQVPHLADVQRLVPLPGFVLRWIRRLWTPRPRILPHCTQCGICAAGCPVKPTAIHPARAGSGPQVEDHRCICCYCCHEFCPQHAIELRQSWLARRISLSRLADRATRWLS
jgi:uncharacterized protein (DUF362 family)/NAD-dependent dihydropyrimidine dehydrogenase PreA subunit